jgi:hypothetical protein
VGELTDKQLSDVGDKVIHHSEYNPRCSLIVPGDCMQEEMNKVDCPECLAHFKQLRQRRAKARG